jgi:TPR repeat protein
MHHYAKLFRATLTASLVLVAIAGASVAGPGADASAAYGRGDYATALRLWRPLAEQGAAIAQVSLGIMYLEGEGVPKDYAEAFKWFRKAADQGDANAQSLLGGMYDEGLGVPQSYVEAVKWYRRSADHGNKPRRPAWAARMRMATAFRRIMPRRSSGFAWLPTRAMTPHSPISASCTCTVMACRKTTPRR